MDGFAFEDVVAGGGGLGDVGGDGRGRWRRGPGGGDVVDADVFDDVHADGCDAGRGGGYREAGEGGHDEAGGGLDCFGLFGDADEEADAGAFGSGGVGAGGLGEDDAGFAR